MHAAHRLWSLSSLHNEVHVEVNDLQDRAARELAAASKEMLIYLIVEPVEAPQSPNISSLDGDIKSLREDLHGIASSQCTLHLVSHTHTRQTARVV